MKVLETGHRYELDNLKGPSTQEVIRACIERVQSLDKELPWKGNERIIFHLRMALIGFEARALERAVEKCEPVELWPVNGRGHLCGA